MNLRIGKPWVVVFQFQVICCILSVIFALWPLHFHPYDASKDAVFIFFVGSLVVTTLILFAVSGRLFFPVSRLSIAVFSYFFYNLILFAVFPYTSAYSFILFAGLVILFYLVSVVSNKNFPKKMMIALSIAATTCSIYGICQFLGYDFWRLAMRSSRFDIGLRIHATFGNPNLVGSFYVFMLPLALSMGKQYWERKNYPAFIWFAAVLILSMISLILCQTRGAWIAAAVAVCFWCACCFGNAIKELFKRIKRVFFAIVLSTLIMSVSGIAWHAVQQFLPSLMESTTIAYRWNWYRETMSMIREKPVFGRGPGTFKVYYPVYKDDREAFRINENIDESYRVEHPHNEFLEILSDSGVFGLVLFCWIIGEFFRMAAERKNCLHIGIGAAVAGLLCDGLFSQNLRFIVISSLLWLAFGLVNSDSSKKSISILHFLPHQFVRMMMAILVSAWLIAYPLELAFRKCAAESLFYRIYRGAPEETAPLLEKIISIDPENKEALLLAGTICQEQGRDDKALSYLNQLAGIDPNYREVNFLLAELYFKSNNIEKARYYCERQVLVNNMNWKSHYNLALLDLKEQKRVSARRYLREILAINKIKKINPGYLANTRRLLAQTTQ